MVKVCGPLETVPWDYGGYGRSSVAKEAPSAAPSLRAPAAGAPRLASRAPRLFGVMAQKEKEKNYTYAGLVTFLCS